MRVPLILPFILSWCLVGAIAYTMGIFHRSQDTDHRRNLEESFAPSASLTSTSNATEDPDMIESVSPTLSPTSILDTLASDYQDTDATILSGSSSTITDLQAFIGAELAQGEKYITIPAGRHYIQPQASNGRVHLLLENLVDVTIDGTDAELICTKTTRAIDIVNCTNLALVGLTIDYDPLPFMQGVIIDISDDMLQLTIELMNGYPESTTWDGNKIEIYSPTDDELTAETYYDIEFVPTSPNSILVNKQYYQATNAMEKVGDIVVIGSRNTEESIPHAIVPSNCTNLVVMDVKIYASNMFGFFEVDSDGSRYINSVVDRRPSEIDLEERQYRRLRSTNGDAFHSKHAKHGPSFVGCTARYSGDDGIAINGHYHIISRVEDGNRLRVIGKYGSLPNLEVGDQAELVSFTGQRIPNAVITAFDKEGVLLEDEERDFLSTQPFTGDTQQTRSAQYAWYVTLDLNVDLPTGSLIASGNRVGNGFEVKDCIIGPTRSRGILIKSSDGVISGNHIQDTWGQAIKLAPECDWLESGSGNNLVITDNIIRRSHDVAIAVYAYGLDGLIAPQGAHNNVTITRNTIIGSSNPAIAVTSTLELEMYGNDIQEQNNGLLLPYYSYEFGRASNPDRSFYLENIDMKTNR
jgi:hypothetical protein